LIVSTSTRTVPVPGRILDASRRDFDLLAPNVSLYGQDLLFLDHQSVRIANVVFQLGKSYTLAEYAGNLR